MGRQRVPLTPGLFTSLEDADDAALLGGRCPDCSEYHFPAQDVCPYCAAAGCATTPLSRTGALYSHTVVKRAPPGYTGPVPYGFGIVELPEGLRVVTRLGEADPQRLAYGQGMRLVIEPLFRDEDGTDVWSYAFVPSEAPPADESPRPVQAPSTDPASDPVWSAVSLVGGKQGREVDVTGVGIHPFGRFPEKSAVEIGQVAVRGALEDAGIGRGGFQAAFCGTVYAGCAAGHRVLAGLGLTGVPIVNVEAGCASGGAALNLAAAAIADGRYDRVLVFGLEKMPSGIIDSSFFDPWRKQGGLAATPAYFGLRARRLMRTSGVTPQHLAWVSVKNHRNGVHNPNAMFRKEFTAESVLASPSVCDPLTLYMLCSPNEGAAAVVLEASSARSLGGALPVRIAASALTSHLPGSVLGEHTPLCGTTNDSLPSPTERAARAAYEAAGIGPGELDVVELQDTDSGRELLSCEELALCERGGAGRLAEERRTEMGGSLPVNPSGGLLSKGEPVGASTLGQIVEICLQLRGEAHGRQVERARVALSHTVGRGANASVVVLKR